MKIRVSTLLLAAATALFLVLLACATNPATGRSQLMLVSSDEEVQMGKQAVPGVIDEYGTYDHAGLQDWTSGIGKKLAAVTERPELPYRYTVLDSPVVNAFALPGGPIFVTRGLIAHAGDEAELASVMGHETGHVVARHSAEQASKQQLLGAGIGIAGAVSQTVGRFSQLLGSGAQLLLLRYSRDAEREADMLGVRYAARAGYDPDGMPRFMGVLDQISRDSKEGLPGWLSTHPDPGERVGTTTRLAREAQRAAQPVTGRDVLLKKVEGIVYGENPAEGFQKGRTFHQPTLKFRFDFPEGWKGVNTRQYVAGANDLQNPAGQVVLKLAPVEAGTTPTPPQYVETLKARNPGATFEGGATSVNELPAWVGAITVKDESGASQKLQAAWIAHGGKLYQFLGAGEPKDAIDRAIRSFRPETDPQFLNVPPAVVRLDRVAAATPLSAYCAGRKDMSVKCVELAEINHLAETDTVPAGTTLKVPVRQSPVFP